MNIRCSCVIASRERNETLFKRKTIARASTIQKQIFTLAAVVRLLFSYTNLTTPGKGATQLYCSGVLSILEGQNCVVKVDILGLIVDVM